MGNDKALEELFAVALKIEGEPWSALRLLIGAGKIARIYKSGICSGEKNNYFNPMPVPEGSSMMAENVFPDIA